MAIKAIRVRDLPERPAPGVMLYCYRCGAEYSAKRGDYFMGPPDYVFRCNCSGHDRLMALVEKQTRHRAIETN